MPIKKAEKHNILIDFWTFALRSFFKKYAQYFFWQVMMKHPLRAAKALFDYRDTVSDIIDNAPIEMFFQGRDAFFEQLAKDRDHSLIAVGYCSKPFTCPSKRFTHHCHALESNCFIDTSGTGLPLPCRKCLIRLAGEKAIQKGYPFYIMTSALDISHDIFLPLSGKFIIKRVLLTLCPFSAGIILYPLLLCRMEGLLFQYSFGNCKNYKQFLMADKGIKKEITLLGKDTSEAFLSLLDKLPSAEDTVKSSASFQGVTKIGNFFKSHYEP